MSTRQLLTSRHGDTLRFEEFAGNVRCIVPVETLLEVLGTLRNDGGFDFLADIAGVDYLTYPNATDRYGVIYCLASTETAERVFVKVLLNDPDPTLPSVYELWKGSDWMEREVYDMFGIRFEGHPDLRRILMPEGFTDYPLRKDYPLRGRGERHNFDPSIRAET